MGVWFEADQARCFDLEFPDPAVLSKRAPAHRWRLSRQGGRVAGQVENRSAFSLLKMIAFKQQPASACKSRRLCCAASLAGA